jgi:hypothetical protein
MHICKRPSGAATPVARDGQQLITLAQQLARDAERHAILSASLASQADRLMLAGLKILQTGSNAKPLAPNPRQVK